MTEQLDKDNLFRTPIRLKGPSAGQMLMKAIDRESGKSAESQVCAFYTDARPYKGQTHAGWEIIGGVMGLDTYGFGQTEAEAWEDAISRIAAFADAPSEAILSQVAPKYSLKTQLWIGAWIFLSIASGVALGFMKGCR